MSQTPSGRGSGGGGVDRGDARFKHVHTDPRFKRAAKSERKFTPDARFQKMFTDEAFNENYKVDAWGRKIDTGKKNELLKYYQLDEETAKQLMEKESEGKQDDKKTKQKKGAKQQPKEQEEEEDEEDAAPAAKSSKAAKSGKSKPAAQAAAKPSKGKQRAMAPPSSEEDDGEDDEEEGVDAMDVPFSENDDEVDDADDGMEGHYFSKRAMAPPSSGEEEGEDEEEEEEGEDAEVEQAEDDEDADASDDDVAADAQQDSAGSSAESESDIEMEAELPEEEEEIPIGETRTRRLAVMNLEWDRLTSTDLLVLFRSFVSQPPGAVSHPVQRVKVYPSQFGLQRMKDEAMYGPTAIYAGGLTAEEYKKKLQAKLEAAKVEIDLSDEEAPEEDSERSDEEEESEGGEDSDSNPKPKKKRVSFPAGIKNSKRSRAASAAAANAQAASSAAAAKAAKAIEEEEEEEEAEQEEEAEDAAGEESQPSGDEETTDILSRPARTNRAGDDGNAEFDAEKLRQYELERLKYYYAIVECATVEAASELYAACDGLEFEHSSNILDLRYVPDDVTFSAEEEATVRDQCSRVPSNYTSPDFYTQALQHTRVQLTWDRDDPKRVKLLQRQFKAGDETAEDLKVYLGSDGEEDGYGTDAVTDAEDSDSQQEEEEDGEDGPAKPKQKAKLKRRARQKYLALLNDIKQPTGGDDDADENREVSITFEPGLKAKGEELARKALNKDAHKEESTWEKHLRERAEKKREKKKARKEKLKALNDPDAAQRADEDSGDEIGAGKTPMQSDLYEDDEVEFDNSDPFFQLSDEEEFEPRESKKGGGARSAIVSDDDGDDEDAISMSSDSHDAMSDDGDSGDGDADSDIDALRGKEKARRFFDDSAASLASKKKNAPPAAKEDKPAGGKKNKRKRSGAADDECDASQRAREQAELELLLMGEDDANEDGVKGYSLKALLKAKKEAATLEAGGKRSKKWKKSTAAAGDSTADNFRVDTQDPRFAALFHDSSFSIDPTNPSFKPTDGTEQLLREKAKRRAQQEREKREEIARRKQEAKKGMQHASATHAAHSNGEDAAASSSQPPSASLASLVASVKRKAAAAKQAPKPIPPASKAPPSKRAKQG